MSKALDKTVSQIIAGVDALTISNEDEYKIAGEWLSKVKRTEKTVMDHFEPERERTYNAYQGVMKERKKFLDIVSTAERSLKKIMQEFIRAEERRRAEEAAERRRIEEENRIAQAIDSGNDEILEAPVIVEKAAPLEHASGTYTVDVWKFEITDVSKISPQFLIADEKRIGAIVRAEKADAVKILGEGVRVYSEKEIRSRWAI